LGTDKILGINSDGVPVAMVDDLEWVINRGSSDKYNRTLGLINADHPSVHHLAGLEHGGRARLASSMAPPPVHVNVPSASGPAELTGTLFMGDGAKLGLVKMVAKDPSFTRQVSHQLAEQRGRDRRGVGSRVQ